MAGARHAPLHTGSLRAPCVHGQTDSIIHRQTWWRWDSPGISGNDTCSARETGTGHIGILTVGRSCQEVMLVITPALIDNGIVIRIGVAYMHRGRGMHRIMGSRKVRLNYPVQAGDESPGETLESLHGVTPS